MLAMPLDPQGRAPPDMLAMDQHLHPAQVQGMLGTAPTVKEQETPQEEKRAHVTTKATGLRGMTGTDVEDMMTMLTKGGDMTIGDHMTVEVMDEEDLMGVTVVTSETIPVVDMTGIMTGETGTSTMGITIAGQEVALKEEMAGEDSVRLEMLQRRCLLGELQPKLQQLLVIAWQ